MSEQETEVKLPTKEELLGELEPQEVQERRAGRSHSSGSN